MNQKRLTLGLLSAVSILAAGCANNAAAPAPAAAPAAPAAPQAAAPATKPMAGSKAMQMCMANFNTDGAYLRGYRFRTHTLLAGASKSKVFANLAAMTAEEGWIITASDANVGTLSANHTRVHAKKTLTQVLSYSLLPTGKDLKVSVTLNTPADIFGSGRDEERLKQQMCESIEKAAR